MKPVACLGARSAKGNRPCIWMQAGVVRQKSCKINYDCASCRFDRAMRRLADENSRLKKAGRVARGNRHEVISWKEKLRALPPSKRPCVHHMKGRIEFRPCTNNYWCGNCDFDQYFHDQYSVHAVISPVDVLEIGGFKVPQGYYFHRGHTWAKIEDGPSVRVGLDEFALRLLGPFDRIETPLMGKEVEQGRADIRVYRGVHQAKVLSPVSGVVTAINPKLRDQGRLANQGPYSEGWVMSVLSNDLRQDIKGLMINTETGDFLEEHVERLYQLIEGVEGPLAADGGHLGNDIFGKIPHLGWERLTRIFLNT
jgi:glycine cleavage system H lipoate-binding protein